MIQLTRWVDRSWVFNLPIGAFPAVLERLRGTPGRAAEMILGVSDDALSRRTGQSWSVKQHLGHLDDLHELDESRLRQYLERAPALVAADMKNRRTHQANHNAAPADAIVARLRARRIELVGRMERLAEEDIAWAATHPRLGQSLRLIDWAVFVAEHDDHHLASARHVLKGTATTPPTRH